LLTVDIIITDPTLRVVSSVNTAPMRLLYSSNANDPWGGAVVSARTFRTTVSRLAHYISFAVLITLCCYVPLAQAADPVAQPPSGPPVTNATPPPAPPSLLRMPFVSSETAASFFAKRQVPKSDVPPLQPAPINTAAQHLLARPPALGHPLPQGDMTPFGRKRADFAIARQQGQTAPGP
jgi:hypothetical protein